MEQFFSLSLSFMTLTFLSVPVHVCLAFSCDLCILGRNSSEVMLWSSQCIGVRGWGWGLPVMIDPLLVMGDFYLVTVCLLRFLHV